MEENKNKTRITTEKIQLENTSSNFIEPEWVEKFKKLIEMKQQATESYKNHQSIE